MFRLSSSAVDERLPELPPVALHHGWPTTIGGSDRVYVDRSGAVRFERYASADATEATTSLLMSGTRVGRTVIVGSKPAWIEQDGAIGEDPRGYLRAVTGLLVRRRVGLRSEAGPERGRPRRRRPQAGDTSAPTPSPGAQPSISPVVASDVWIDDVTRLILRNRVQVTDDAGNPVPAPSRRPRSRRSNSASNRRAVRLRSAGWCRPRCRWTRTTLLCRPGQDTVAFLGLSALCGNRGHRHADAGANAQSRRPLRVQTRATARYRHPTRAESAGPLTWTQARLKQDWPAPVRPEPAGGASVAADATDIHRSIGRHRIRCPSLHRHPRRDRGSQGYVLRPHVQPTARHGSLAGVDRLWGGCRRGSRRRPRLALRDGQPARHGCGEGRTTTGCGGRISIRVAPMSTANAWPGREMDQASATPATRLEIPEAFGTERRLPLLATRAGYDNGRRGQDRAPSRTSPSTSGPR